MSSALRGLPRRMATCRGSTDAFGIVVPTFLQSCREATGEVNWERFHEHEFIRGAVNGTLPENSFRHYQEQEKFFGEGFNRAVRVVAQNPDLLREEAAFLVGAGTMCEDTTKEALSPAAGTGKASRLTAAFVDFMAAASSRSSFEALTALSPTVWLYRC
eukprot:TRINITY_DN36858_c0_g1_i4.p1 TRINITY_DN36858_c0_g1~~TRINITY_DN36858_c0_g1_i4.p1  ORF type:complete len:159 (+),score=14.81 TRINITY_DN36858_c0_g1_i4:56-532(+)